jgi:DNA replication protein DnaC
MSAAAPANQANPFEDRLAAMLRAAQESKRRFESQLDQVPTERPCDVHHHHTAVFNREASLARFELIYRCPTCVREARERAFIKLQEESGIPPNVRHASLANFITDRPLLPSEITDDQRDTPKLFVQVAESFIERQVLNLVFSGSVGIGKGHLAAAIGNRRLMAGHTVKFIRVQSLFDLIHDTYSRTSTARATEIIRSYTTPNLLILDEVALNPLPTDGERILFDIIDERDQHNRQILMTTNQPFASLEAWFGDRLWDRLHHSHRTPPLFLYGQWASYRSV